MKHLSNNTELSDYRQFLAKTLEERHAKELGEAVAHASRMSPFMSTEFLGESRIALRQLAKEGTRVLTKSELDDVKEVLSQIDGEFERKRCQA